jgi:hypothetical protein
MKTMYRIFILPAAIIALIFSCRKTPTDVHVDPSDVATATVPTHMDFTCSNPVSYGDSIIYPQPTNGDYIVSPVNGSSLGAGKYFAWPVGMIIDSVTGAIDMTASQTGLRYVVGFAKQGTTDTCLSNIILSGVNYVDSVYDLDKGDTLCYPYFNANVNVPSPCDSSNDTDYPNNGLNNGLGNGNNKCSFDGTGTNGQKGQANAKGVKVRSLNGVINLMATMTKGAFAHNPHDGETISVPVFYTINNQTHDAKQEITVKITYYDSKSDIPASMMQTIEANRNAFFNNSPMLNQNPRPPLIIIVRRGF